MVCLLLCLFFWCQIVMLAKYSCPSS
jgi:hypothetical protein